MPSAALAPSSFAIASLSVLGLCARAPAQDPQRHRHVILESWEEFQRQDGRARQALVSHFDSNKKRPVRDLRHFDCRHASYQVEGVNFIVSEDVLHRINGVGTHDVVTGTPEANSYETGYGNDDLRTGDGSDWVNSGPGDDEIHLGRDHDAAGAGTGDDQLIGGSGDDILYGGKGADTLRGDDPPRLRSLEEAGADVFVYRRGDAVPGAGGVGRKLERVLDFEVGKDTIQLEEVDPATVFLRHEVDEGGSVRASYLYFGEDDAVRVEGVRHVEGSDGRLETEEGVAIGPGDLRFGVDDQFLVESSRRTLRRAEQRGEGRRTTRLGRFEPVVLLSYAPLVTNLAPTSGEETYGRLRLDLPNGASRADFRDMRGEPSRY